MNMVIREVLRSNKIFCQDDTRQLISDVVAYEKKFFSRNIKIQQEHSSRLHAEIWGENEKG